MYKSIMNNCKLLTFAIVIISYVVLLPSCTVNRPLGYNIAGLATDTLKVELPDLKFPQPVIQPDDILEIRFSGANPQTVTDINSKGNSYGYLSGQGSSNYLVDHDGNIEVYLLGKVKAAGSTKEQLKDKLLADIGRFLKDATVVVRFINFRFTILGEVKGPGTFSIPNEKISILEAIAMTGDLTPTAKRENIRVIRDSSGIREIGTVNFNQKTLFTSPYYYLHRNDIIIVEKSNRGQSAQMLSTLSSIIGIVASIITLFYLVKK